MWAHPDHAHLFDAIRDSDAVYAARLRFARENGVPEEWQDATASVAEELEGIEAPPEPDRELLDGVTIDTALGPLEVVETPGPRADATSASTRASAASCSPATS